MALFVDLISADEQLVDTLTYLHKLQSSKDGVEAEASDAQLEALKKAFDSDARDVTISKLIAASSVAFSQVSERDQEVEALFLTLYNATRRIEGAARQTTVQALIDQIISSTDDKPALRLQVISSIYNVVEAGALRTQLFLAILQYANKSQQADILYPQLKHIDDWLDEWHASVEDRREVYQSLYALLKSVGTDNIESYNVLRKYLTNFENADDATLALSKDNAVIASVLAIRLPDIHQCDDLLELKAVQQLKTDSKHAKLYELLALFTTGKLDAYKSFHNANPDYVQSVGLSHEDCLKKIRLLSLATLASENPTLSFELISTTLDISQDEVEDWVVIAISTGLLEAKINELKRIVNVQRCTQRVFERAQWEALHGKVSRWKENVHNLLVTLRTTCQTYQTGR